MLASREISQFEIRAFVRRALQDLRSVRIEDLDTPLVVRFPVGPCNLLAWLNGKQVAPAFYFQSRDQSWEIAGIGRFPARKAVSISLAHWDELQNKHPDAQHLRLFFARNFSSRETWSEFALLQNVMPLAYIERVGSAYFETHLIPGSFCKNDAETSALVSDLLQKSPVLCEPADCPLPKLGARKDHPAEKGWHANVAVALQAITNGGLEKVVLARQTDFTMQHTLDPLALLQTLRHVQQRVYHFLYMPKHGQSFLGASPERLFQIKNSQIKTEALAGTVARRMASNQENLFSTKILHEHSCVIEGIKQRLQNIATSIISDAAPAPLGLADLIHLRTKLRASLKKDFTVDEVLQALHPTAAVCGEPELEAAELIEKLEPFKRGLYAGPVGVLRGQDAECAVALRSCLVQPQQLSIFAGAGIVAGSNAHSEWQELETKIATLLKLFE